VRRIADTVLVLDAGAIADAADIVAADPAVRDAYLGRHGL
jgi:ABC-type branched-subunit amino acid transport system ATPase component